MKFPQLLIGCLCLQAVGSLQAQNQFAFFKIPPTLLPNANTVVRKYELEFEVINKGEALATEHRVVTLLNEKAQTETEQTFSYDKLVKIEDIEGAIYDATGKLVRKIKKKDISDTKMLEYFVSDGRVKTIEFPRMAFPYTIEYTVKRTFKGLMFYPVFAPQTSPSEAVESATCVLKMPPGLEARVKEINVPIGAKTQAYHWQFKHLNAFSTEKHAPDREIPFPVIITAPTLFTLEGYDGDMSDWNSFGRFIWKLNQEKAAIPDATLERLKTITADCPDDRCKVERVYQFLQDNTRYFFVGLGIGGWQPSPAGEVDEFKYGDCKGLSNYMVSMLKALGIPAYYVLIRAGDDEKNTQFPDFPNAWFNHAIACAPLSNDTIWLECTSQKVSCGFMSDFTDDRPALIITEQGGKLVKTPRYDASVNTIRRTTTVQLNPDGNAVFSTKGIYRAIAQQALEELVDKHDEERKKAFYEQINLKDFEITSVDLKQKKGAIPEVEVALQLHAPRFAAASGKRLFVPVCALSETPDLPPVDTLRRFSIQADSRGFTEEDELVIQLPEGYTLENAVQPSSYRSDFGSYDLTISNEPGGKLLIKRKFSLNDSIQPKEKYKEWVDFLKQVNKADKTKLVLAKGT
ncbi:MAG: DUF3857 domain-containing transglutaminase family protein [Saprospiraceae bacterium]|nr:DUF3857 domain-containing transglutaminase family protein [Saprospiraceae bacterium]